jgi:protein-ribulosamine 3-kinase
MIGGPPTDPGGIDEFTGKIAQLHQSDLGKSPKGRYGFGTTTYMGPLPQDNTWCDTWEAFFVQGMKRMLALEKKAQGPGDALDTLAAQLYDKVVPRLLRPLDVLGSIQPALVHGHLWHGNVGIVVESNDAAKIGTSVVFDACGFWAHNECTSSLFRPLSKASHTSIRHITAFRC